jgi:hypothetical protein
MIVPISSFFVLKGVDYFSATVEKRIQKGYPATMIEQ